LDTTADQFPSQPEIAARLPQYRLVSKLSETRMSVIYLAEEKALGDRRVAIKILAPMLAHERAFRDRFRRETLAAANLAHPNIVPVYAAPPDDELLYLVMPFIDGPNLRSLLQQGPLDPWRTAYVVTEVAKALDFAHSSGVVHRDVKPSNILLDQRTDRVYLCDFGIATPVSGERLTEVGRFVGTPQYIAPERIPDSAVAELPPVDGRADVYSLGVVLYQCLTGHAPHAGSDTGGVLWAQRHQDPPPVSSVRPDLPRALDQVVATAMARDPRQRYTTCQQLADAVYQALTGRVVRPPTRRPLRWKPITAIAAALVLVAAGIVVVPTFFGGDDPDGETLARIPAALRGNCSPADAADGRPGATSVLSCMDGEQTVRFSLYDNNSAVDSAYNDAIEDSGVARGSGDCQTATGAEHRYPNGNPVGRALCYASDGTTTILWTDDRRHTIGEAQRREGDDAGLAKAWSRWVGIPAFPTDEEKSLMRLVGKTDCRRSPAGSLESFRDVVAAVDCKEADRGAREVSYYTFSTMDGLRRTFDAHVSTTESPPGVYCPDDPENAFHGYNTYDLRSSDLGTLLCYTSKDGEPTVEWTMEPFLLLARATGRNTPTDLADYWDNDWGPSVPEVIKAVNKRDGFPNADERALLDHIPEVSRKQCIRPGKDQVEVHVGDAKVTGVVCGPPRGANIVFYYQFADTTTMNSSYQTGTSLSNVDCTTYPADFVGEGPYVRDGTTTGRLLCGNNSGVPYLGWTNDQLNIMVFAFKGNDPTELINWWLTEAGPI
jgi:eukaryotic-like serine/threonine-protein kinase